MEQAPAIPPIHSLELEQTSIYCSPLAFIDKRGNPILIKPLSEKLHEQLKRMYLDYEPRDDFAGLPPIRDDECVKWVEGMIRNGVNLVALSFGEGIIGHAAIFPMGNQTCEMLIVLIRGHQNTGIGTQMTRLIIQLAYELEFERVWLSVGAGNRIARHVYAKCGFEYIAHCDDSELEMTVDLKRYYQMKGITVKDVMNRRVVSIHENSSCREAIGIFVRKRIGALPVVNDVGEVVGILSETDLVVIGNYNQKVRDVSTKQVITVRPHCPLSKVVRLFQSKKMRCIPVLDRHGKLAGIVGRRDILAYYCRTDLETDGLASGNGAGPEEHRVDPSGAAGDLP